MQRPALRCYFDALLRAPVLLIIPSAVDPPVREAGLAPWVKWSAPLGRTTRGAWSARLARVDGGRRPQATYGPGRPSPIIPESESPAGGNIDARAVSLGSHCRWSLITCGDADLRPSGGVPVSDRELP